MKKIILAACAACVAFGAFAWGKKKAEAKPEKTEKQAAAVSVKLGAEVEKTFGFADLGAMKYPEGNVIVIDDRTYTDVEAKRRAFINAISSGSVTSAAVTEESCLILLYGTVDLSGGVVSDSDHSYFDKFDPETHQRINRDFMFDVGSNKTILGMERARVAYGGLRIKATEKNPAKNVIIRNIEFWDAHGSTEYDTKVSQYSDKKASADQLVVEGIEDKSTKANYLYVPENIWIDHCSFSDGVCKDLDRNFNHDGALDVKCVHNMTVSFCEFTNHDKVTLTGSSDKFVTAGERQITFHHNYYHGTVQRMPRSRGCQIHIYNNVYDQIGTSGNHGYIFGPGVASLFIIEGNSIGKTMGRVMAYADKSKSGDPTFSRFYASGNEPELNAKNSEGFSQHKSEEKPFEIQYNYTLESAKSAKSSVPEAAGATLKIEVAGR